MDYLFVILVSLCIGSFLNVCIYRIPLENQNVAFPPSHCTNCDYELKWYDNIPVLSYIILGGKCRNCKQKISIQYPMIELFNCIVCTLIYMKYGMEIETLKYMFLTSLMIVIGMIDFKTQYVYLSTIVTGLLIGIGFFIYDWISIGEIPMDNVYGLLVGVGVIGLIFAITLGGGMGFGDVEIAAVAGLFLGFKATIFNIFFAFIVGGIVAAITLIVKKKKGKEAIAFGPYLAIGCLFSIFFGNTIINMYINNFLQL